MSDDIVKRLEHVEDEIEYSDVAHICGKAAEEIECLRAEVERLTRERDECREDYQREAKISSGCMNALIHSERKVEKLREALIDATASLTAAHSLLKRGGKKAAPSDKMFEQMLLDYEASADRARAVLAETEKTDD